MAFSFGFFNSKNLDRTYTAENFNDYLGSIICDGIQDNFGQCFKLSASKLKLTIGSGKAWIHTPMIYLAMWTNPCRDIWRLEFVATLLKTSVMSALKFSPELLPPILQYRDFRIQITRNISPFALLDLMRERQNSALQITEKTIISADMSAVFLANARLQICFRSFLKFRRR